MVKAEFKADRSTGFLSMDVKGHAGFAELGRDPVCAGASVLAMTVASCIRGMEKEDKLQKKAHVVVRNGHVKVTAMPKPAFYGEALHTFFFGETGMQMLSEAYPGHVQFTPFVPPEKG